jgi:hypothetical protein
MKARATRIVAVGTTPVNIRKTPSGSNDVTAAPVAKAKLRYASGGGTIQLVPLSSSAFGDGEDVDADGDYMDIDQSLSRWAVSSAGSVNVAVTDYEG